MPSETIVGDDADRSDRDSDVDTTVAGATVIRLPTLEATDETIQIGDARLAVTSSPGHVWVTDLNASSGIRNRPGSLDEVFVAGNSNAPTIVGRLVPMPTEIDLEAKASMNWVNEGWEVRHRWDLNPSTHLGGRLAIQTSEPLSGERILTAVRGRDTCDC